ncbi:MAG: hypothetical protein JJU12_06635 [Chlamydiales bacterium]|nr:hypothetical protein [Chlamydiales bacterium]
MLRVSKWLKIPLLVDKGEMEELFAALPAFSLYQVQRVTSIGEGIMPPEDFLAEYRSYIETLKRGEVPPSLSSPVLSLSYEAMFAMPVDEGRQLYKPKLPVVQMQAHAIRYSDADQSFRSQLFGSDAITWGIQLGYPQIFEDPATYEIKATRDLPNGPLFRAIQKWVRSHTRPTPFLVSGRKQNVPIRLGKACFSWINSHPQLKERGIEIDAGAASPSIHSK